MFEKIEVSRSSTVRNNVIFLIVINTIHHNTIHGNTTHVRNFYALVKLKIIGAPMYTRSEIIMLDEYSHTKSVGIIYYIERNAYCITWHTIKNINK